MASTYKVLGQADLTTTSLTTIYTVPAATQAVCSTLVIASRATSCSFSVAVIPSGQTISNKHYICYSSPIEAVDSIFLTIGLTLQPGDVIQVSSNLANNISVNLFGQEIA